jgi:hypothetical protein
MSTRIDGSLVMHTLAPESAIDDGSPLNVEGVTGGLEDSITVTGMSGRGD